MGLIDVVSRQSNIIWNYLRAIQNNNAVTYGEVTITEELLRNILILGQSTLTICDPPDIEAETGADFFWNIKCNNKEYNLAFQAKKAKKRDSKYTSINHKVKKNMYQIDVF